MTRPTTAQKIAQHQARNEFLLLHYCPWSYRAIAVALLVVVLAVLRMPSLLHLGSACIGGISGDGGLYYWLMNAMAANPLQMLQFETPAFYPYGYTLAWSDNFILPSLIALPFLKLGINPVLVYNLLMLGAALLTGTATFCLAFALIGRLLPALLSATSFMALGFFTYNTGHPQLQFAFWLPLALHLWIYFLSRRTVVAAIPVGLVVGGAFLTTAYYAIFMGILLGAVTVALLCLRPGVYHRTDALRAAAGILLGTIPLVPFVLPYLAVRATFGERGIYEAFYFAAKPQSFLSAPETSILYDATSMLSHPEAFFFPGLVLLVLAGIALSRLRGTPALNRAGLLGLGSIVAVFILFAWSPIAPWQRTVSGLLTFVMLGAAGTLLVRLGQAEHKHGFSVVTNRAIVAMLAAALLVAWILALGPLGNPEKGQWTVSLFRFAYELVPGFNSIRAISRIGILALLMICLLAGFAVARIAEHTRRGIYFIPALLALIVLENLQSIYPSERPPEVGGAWRQLALEADPGDVAIAIPLTATPLKDGEVASWGDFAATQVTAMIPGLQSNVRLVNGYSGQRTKLMRELPRELAKFPDARSLTALSAIAGLRYIVVRSQLIPQFNEAEFIAAVARLTTQLRYHYRDEAGNFLLELVPDTWITDETFLLVPGRSQQNITLELKALYEKNPRGIEVTILSDDEALTPLTSFKIPTSGEVHSYTFQLQHQRTVRPIKLRFRVAANERIYLGRSTALPAS